MQEEDGSLDGILDTVLDVHPGKGYYTLSALQLRDELKELAHLVAAQSPNVVMEIGTAQGGTLYTWSKFLETPSKYISLDIPGRSFSGKFNKRRQDYFDRFDSQVETDFVWQNSHLDDTFQTVRDGVLNAEEEVDFLFIDGDHTYEGVKQDFEMYKKLVSDDGIIAFHDIVYHPDDPEFVNERRSESDAEPRHLQWTEGHPECDVDKFWAEIKDNYETTEMISHPDQTWGGIGIVYL